MEKMPEMPKLPKSGKFRIYDFQYGKYGEAFSYTYDLDEDVERKLAPGLYNVGYKNTDGAVLIPDGSDSDIGRDISGNRRG
jgi:hypothetical protein